MAVTLQWTEDEIKEIARQYWADRIAYCPVDDAKLAIARDHTRAQPRLIAVHCTRCGRHAENVE